MEKDIYHQKTSKNEGHPLSQSGFDLQTGISLPPPTLQMTSGGLGQGGSPSLSGGVIQRSEDKEKMPGLEKPSTFGNHAHDNSEPSSPQHSPAPPPKLNDFEFTYGDVFKHVNLEGKNITPDDIDNELAINKEEIEEGLQAKKETISIQIGEVGGNVEHKGFKSLKKGLMILEVKGPEQIIHVKHMHYDYDLENKIRAKEEEELEKQIADRFGDDFKKEEEKPIPGKGRALFGSSDKKTSTKKSFGRSFGGFGGNSYSNHRRDKGSGGGGLINFRKK